MLNQFAKISPIVDEYGYLLSPDENGDYTKRTGIKLKENEIGICTAKNCLIAMHKGVPVIMSEKGTQKILTYTLSANETTEYTEDILLYNNSINYIISRVDIQFTEDDSTGTFTYYVGTDQYSYCRVCLYTDISNSSKRYVMDTDNTGMNSTIINKAFSGKLYIRLLPNHLDDSEINYSERITKIIGDHPIRITITYDQEG